MIMPLIEMFFIYICFHLVLNHKQNIADILEDYDQTKNNFKQLLNHSYSHNQQLIYNTESKFDKNRPHNLTMDEMDTIMFCSIIVQENLRIRKTEIEYLTKKMNLSSTNPVYEKIGTDIFEVCIKKANIKIVNTFIINLTYFNNFKWSKNFEKFGQISFNRYKTRSDLYLTHSQRILLSLYERVDEIFRQKRVDQLEKFEKEKKQGIKDEDL